MLKTVSKLHITQRLPNNTNEQKKFAIQIQYFPFRFFVLLVSSIRGLIFRSFTYSLELKQYHFKAHYGYLDQGLPSIHLN